MIFLLSSIVLLSLLGLLWLAVGYYRYDARTFSGYPTLEILLPCHNEEQDLPGLFAAMEALQWPVPLRFAVIDDRSTDKTQALMAEFVNRDTAYRRLIVIGQGEAPEVIARKKYALTKAVETSTAAWVLTFDADSRPGTNWLFALFAGWSNEWIAIIPPFRFSEGEGFWGGIRRLEAVVQSFLMRGAIQIRHPLAAIGAGFAYRVAAFRQVGGFTGKIGERISGDDDLLLHKFTKLSGSIVSQVGKEVTLAVRDREANNYWRVRARHYSVAPDYPIFWKLFGFLVIPGVIIAPFLFLLLLSPILTGHGTIWHPATVLLITEYIFVSKIARQTSTAIEWWHPAALFFGFPFWAAAILWHTLRRRPGWS